MKCCLKNYHIITFNLLNIAVVQYLVSFVMHQRVNENYLFSWNLSLYRNVKITQKTRREKTLSKRRVIDSIWRNCPNDTKIYHKLSQKLKIRIAHFIFWNITIRRDANHLSAISEFWKVDFDVEIPTCEKLQQNVELQIKLEGFEESECNFAWKSIECRHWIITGLFSDTSMQQFHIRVFVKREVRVTSPKTSKWRKNTSKFCSEKFISPRGKHKTLQFLHR